MNKILFILPTLNQGGSEKIYSYLVQNWPDTEVDCKLLILSPIKDEDLIRFNLSPEKVSSLNKDRALFSFWALYKKLKATQPQVVFSTIGHLNIVVLLISYLVKTKIIIRESSVPSVRINNNFKLKLLGRLMKIFYKKADNIICQSEDIRIELESNYHVPKSKLILINNPIDINKIPEKVTNDSSVLRMVYTARFEPVKGHDRLIQILEQIDRPFHLRLIGEGSGFNDFKIEISKVKLQGKIEFLGWINQPYKHMIDCDLYIQPSYVEGFPNSLLEACAMGLPVIAYNVPGGTKEILNENNGILIKDGDYVSFSRSINKFSVTNYNAGEIRNDINLRFSSKTILEKYKKLTD